MIRLTAGPIDILYFIIFLLLKCVNAKEISQKGKSCTSLTLYRFCSSVYSDALHQCGLPSDIHLHRRTHLCSRCILRPQVLLLLPGMSRLTLAHSLVQPESYSPVTENHVILVNETSNLCVHCRSPVEINVAKMGNSETKKRTTADYTGPQSNQARVKRSLTLNPQKRKQSVRLKNRPASIDGSTGLWDGFDPSRRRYLETDLDLYHELQNHLENARRRMRDKGKKDVSGGLDANLVTGEEKCYDPNDTTLTFVEGDDDMDCK